MIVSDLYHKAGFTLVETMIALGISTIASLAIVGYIAQYKAVVQQQKLMVFQNHFINSIEDSISTSSICSQLLRNATTSLSSTISSTATGDKIALPVQPFLTEFKSPTFTFSEINISYHSDPVDDQSNWSSARNYNGMLTFNIDFIGNKFPDYKHLLKPLTIPIILFDSENSEQWSNIECASGRSSDSFLVGQICNLYGGTLTDGIHCDFVRSKSAPYDINNPPTHLLNQNSGSPTHRITMSDILCYLDTLIIMAPTNLPVSYRSTTRFCKYPGTDTKQLNSISKNVRDIFLEVAQ